MVLHGMQQLAVEGLMVLGQGMVGSALEAAGVALDVVAVGSVSPVAREAGRDEKGVLKWRLASPVLSSSVSGALLFASIVPPIA